MLTFIAILVITTFTIAGSYYARKFEKPDGLIALYVLFTTLSQIMAAKIATFDLIVVTVTAPAAVLVFAVTFLITDIVNEPGRVGNAVLPTRNNALILNGRHGFVMEYSMMQMVGKTACPPYI